MTITVTTTRNSFAGNGNQGPHSIGFTILDATHIQVYWDKGSSSPGTPTGLSASGYLTKDTHYTVQNAGTSSNATITYIATGWTVSSTVTYPPSGDTIVVTRNVALTQGSDYTNNSTIDAETIENSFDKLTQITQQLDDGKDYSIKFASNLAGSTGFNSTADTAGTITQNKSDRISKILAFDDNGDISVTQELGTYRGNWATGQNYVLRDLVKQSSASDSSTQNNVYICTTAHASTGSYLTENDTSNWTLVLEVAAAQASADTATTQATKAGRHEDNAEAYAQTTAETLVTYTNPTSGATSNDGYSSLHYREKAKEWAGTGTGYALVTDDTGANTTEYSAKAWAAKPSGTVDGATASAKVSAANAATSALNASTSESNAANSATAAATSAANAAASYDSFDDRYLGTFSSNPTQDNDGNALVTGALYFNTSDGEMKVYDGGTWIAASAAQNATVEDYTYTLSGSDATISGSDDNSATLSFSSQESVDVFFNGVKLVPKIGGTANDYHLDTANTVTLTSTAVSGDVILVRVYKTFTVGDAVPASTGGTFSGNVAVNGDLTVDTSTLKVDSSGNKVGVGTASPTKALTVNNTIQIQDSATPSASAGTHLGHSSNNFSVENKDNGGTIFYNNGSETMRITSSGKVGVGTDSSDAAAGKLNVKDGTNAEVKDLITVQGYRYSPWQIRVDDTTSSVSKFQVGFSNNTEALSITDGGEVTIITDGDLVIGTAGHGIDFSNATDHTTGESSVGSVLDDYEEGTWTVTLNNSGSASVSDAKYRKVGNMVTVWARLNNISTTASYDATALLVATPVPSISGEYAAGSFMGNGINLSGKITMSTYVYNNNIYFYSTADSYGSWAHLNWQHLYTNGASDIIFVQPILVNNYGYYKKQKHSISKYS